MKNTTQHIAVLFLLSLMGLGWTSVASANADDVHECKKDYDLALSVMQQRQKDNNLIEAMQTFNDKKLVMDAYSKPQQKTIRLRIEAAKNFANHSAQWCFKWGKL